MIEIEQFQDDAYRGIDHDRLMAYVVSQLEAAGTKLSFENITVAAFRMFPRVFSLDGFPEYPDGARVVRTLLHCRPKYKDYVAGAARHGYYLTSRGRSAAQEAEQMLRSSNGRRIRGVAKQPKNFVERIVSDLKKTPAFQKWDRGATVDENDYYELLHLMPGEPWSAVLSNFEVISEAVADSDDASARAFTDFVQQSFVQKRAMR